MLSSCSTAPTPFPRTLNLQKQVDLLVDFLGGASVLRHLQPSHVRSVAQAVVGQLVR